MALQRLVEEALCRSEIPMLAKEEFDRIANAVVFQDQTMGRLE